MYGKFHGDEIVGCLRVLAVRSWMVLDAQLRAVDDYSQITKVLVVIVFERHVIFAVG